MKNLRQIQQKIACIQNHLWGEIVFIPDTMEHCQRLTSEYYDRYGLVLV